MNNQYPKVFIVLLNHNGKEWLKDSIADLYKIDYPNFEIVVVDNNSTDGSLEGARLAFPRVSYIKNEENIGYAAGNNVAIRYAMEKQADYILLLGVDAKANAYFLKKLVAVGESSEYIGLVSPLIYFKDTTRVWFSGGKINWFAMRTTLEHKDLKKTTKETQFLSSCAMLVKKEVFKKIGLLDEDYFLYLENVDFSFRARRAGYEAVVTPDSTISYWEKEENNKNKTYWLIISGLIFFRKNTPVYFQPWIKLYLSARKIKNWLYGHSSKKEIDSAENKAFKDFRYVKLRHNRKPNC